MRHLVNGMFRTEKKKGVCYMKKLIRKIGAGFLSLAVAVSAATVLSVSAADPVGNNKALKITSNSTEGSNAKFEMALADVLKPNTAYSMKISVKLDIEESAGNSFAQVLNDGTALVTLYDVYDGAHIEDWKDCVKEFTTPADVSKVSFCISLWHAKGSVMLDNVYIYEKESGNKVYSEKFTDFADFSYTGEESYNQNIGGGWKTVTYETRTTTTLLLAVYADGTEVKLVEEDKFVSLYAAAGQDDVNVQWNKMLDHETLSEKGQIKLSLDVMTKDVATLETNPGFFTAEIQLYNGTTYLKTVSIFSVTSGSSDWVSKESALFEIPAEANHVYVSACFYRATGYAAIDNIKITAADGTVLMTDDLNVESLNNTWKQNTYAGAGEFKHETKVAPPPSSGDNEDDKDGDTDLPEGNRAVKIASADASKSVRLSYKLKPELFEIGKTYHIVFSMKADSIQGTGLAHGSINFLTADEQYVANKISKDVAYVEPKTGACDWSKFKYTFTIPSDYASAQLGLGLYKVSGNVFFDDIQIFNESGKVIFYEDFEEGITKDWEKTEDGTFEVFGYDAPKGDRNISVKAETEDANVQWNKDLDLTALKGKGTLTVSVDMKAVGIDNKPKNGFAYAQVDYFKNSQWLKADVIHSVSGGSEDWATYTMEINIPADATRAMLNLGIYQAKGSAYYDNVVVKSADGKVLYKEDFNDFILEDWQQKLYSGKGSLDHNYLGGGSDDTNPETGWPDALPVVVGVALIAAIGCVYSRGQRKRAC